jgi:hypothetical protein
MQQPGILQPAEADSQSIGRRRFTEVAGWLAWLEMVSQVRSIAWQRASALAVCAPSAPR